MPVIPLPVAIAALLVFLLARWLHRGGTHPLLLTLIGLCAAQSLVLALNQHYGWTVLRPLQPVTATFIPMTAWLAFVATTQRPLAWPRDAVHAIGPLALAAAVSVMVQPMLLDALVPGLFAGYGIAMLVTSAAGSGGMPAARLESGDVPAWLWRIMAVGLLISAACDVLIVLDLTLGDGSWRGVIFGATSSLTLLLVGAMSLSSEHAAPPVAGDAAEPAPPPADPEADAALVARLDVLMRDKSPYLDPDLTLAQLARKLTVPAKTLSAAINRHHGENVSRLINRYRIEHACKLLRQSRGITSALFDSGFNTKSNFNREFLRVKEMTPSDWLTKEVNAENP